MKKCALPQQLIAPFLFIIQSVFSSIGPIFLTQLFHLLTKYLCVPTRLIYLTLVSHFWWTLARGEGNGFSYVLTMVRSCEATSGGIYSPSVVDHSVRPSIQPPPHLYVHLRMSVHSHPLANISMCSVCPYIHLRPLVLAFITVHLYLQSLSAVISPPSISIFIHCWSLHLHPHPPVATNIFGSRFTPGR